MCPARHSVSRDAVYSDCSYLSSPSVTVSNFCRCDADAWWRTRCPVDSFFEYQLTRVIKSQKTLRDTFILLITHRWISAGRTGVNRIEIYSTDTHTHRTQQNTLTLTQNTARHGTHEELVFVFYFLIRHQKFLSAESQHV